MRLVSALALALSLVGAVALAAVSSDLSTAYADRHGGTTGGGGGGGITAPRTGVGTATDSTSLWTMSSLAASAVIATGAGYYLVYRRWREHAR